MSEESDEAAFTLLPPGTVVFEPFQAHVTILFPSDDAAIVFYEFLRSFVAGDIDLHAEERKK